MKNILYAIACLMLTSSLAFAEVEKTFRAFVVSVDSKARTIRFRKPDEATPPKWSEVQAQWGDSTKWESCPEKIYKCGNATADLVQTLKKDSKVFVDTNDQSSQEKTWHIDKLSTMPPDSTIP